MACCKPYFVVGISGATNSGKSTVAATLCELLARSKHMCQDNYFLEPDDPRVEKDEDGVQDWDRLSALNMDRMVEDVQQWMEKQKLNNSNTETEKAILIIEGFLIFSDKALSSLFDKKFFIKVDKQTCEKRRQTRTYNPPDPPGYFEKTAWPNYVKHLDSLQDQLDIEYIDGMTDLETMSKTILSSIQLALQEGTKRMQYLPQSTLSVPPPPPRQQLPLPPPPPLPPVSTVQNKMKSNLETGGTNLGQIYTSVIKESRKAYSHFLYMKGLPQDAKGDHTFMSSYSPVQPVIQNGPICGMVALAMASELAGCSNVTTEELFTEACRRGYTKQGEMFSAKSLQELASHFLSLKVEMVQLKQNSSAEPSDGMDIIEQLLQRNLVLIPYDADKNHGPCQKRGHKAHWALLTGFFMALRVSDVPDCLLTHCEKDKDISSLYYLPDSPNQTLLEQLSSLVKQKCEDFFVFGHHGKSKYPGIWPLNELLRSNDNLLEAGPERSSEDYVLPVGGLQAGLQSKAVVIKRNLCR